ncbi:variable surface protein, partial [Plasmodium gonderi]
YGKQVAMQSQVQKYSEENFLNNGIYSTINKNDIIIKNEWKELEYYMRKQIYWDYLYHLIEVCFDKNYQSDKKLHICAYRIKNIA